MSEYAMFLEEKNKIDYFFDHGYQIQSLFENLSGTFVEFSLNEENVQLQLVTPEGRKYIGTKLMTFI
ncbi:hypothetical protein U5N28_10220 [Lysinibacillus telephonicus]|uniref:Uncharacterized protein n=1 Tax=Lysinibacillus telephonicus TaxID=1714840 RepID=A0A3S0HQ61_9BACI|nr:hypothetical protein [Lysinibacillus telephonicus]RTQ96301.1 hypothetical protein EKG35_01220 [Lysinibacillus telephonicus]